MGDTSRVSRMGKDERVSEVIWDIRSSSLEGEMGIWKVNGL